MRGAIGLVIMKSVDIKLAGKGCGDPMVHGQACKCHELCDDVPDLDIIWPYEGRCLKRLYIIAPCNRKLITVAVACMLGC